MTPGPARPHARPNRSDPRWSRAWQSHDDDRLMQALARNRLAQDWPAVRFHPGDVDWWVVQTHGGEPDMTGRVRLWFDQAGELAAFGWYSPPNDLDFLIAPSGVGVATGLVAEIVAWADGRKAEHGAGVTEPLHAWVATSDGPGLGGLMTLGFEVGARPGYVQLTGDMAIADDWPAPHLPPGFSLRRLADDADIEARVVCGRAAFPGSTMTAERYRTVRDAWLYRADLDVQILAAGEHAPARQALGEQAASQQPASEQAASQHAPARQALAREPATTEEPAAGEQATGGRVAAFALGWYDEESGIVGLEPVGVHPDWQRRGLGAEVCRAVLRAARDLGARRVMIAAERSNVGALALYANLGLSITSDIVSATRPMPAPVTDSSG